MKRLFAFLAVALLCNASYAVGAPIKVGLLAPITGQYASEGQDMRKLVSLLVDEVNAKGGIKGNPVELVVEDDGSAPRSAANAANRLVAQGVPVVIGTYGSAITQASQDIFDEAGIIQVATGSTSVNLTGKGLKLFFRTCPRDDEQARVAVETLEKFQYKKIAVLHDNSAYGKGLAEEAKALIEGKPELSITFYDALQPQERDYTAILTKIKGVNPDVVFFTGYYPEAGMLLRQMAEMKWHVPMIGGDAANNVGLVNIAGPKAAAGYRFISPPMPGDLPSATAQNFLQAYVGRYKTPPSSIWSVVAGDAFIVLSKAMEAVGTDPQDIAKYLHDSSNTFDGLTGNIAFDEHGDRIGDLYRLYEVDETGRFVLQDK